MLLSARVQKPHRYYKHGGAAYNERDSVWLRVIQQWTGSEYGIKSKMYKGQGANELVLDDSTNEQRIRVATDHGKTELNQGYLVHPRVDGKGTPRGEGFESDKLGLLAQ